MSGNVPVDHYRKLLRAVVRFETGMPDIPDDIADVCVSMMLAHGHPKVGEGGFLWESKDGVDNSITDCLELRITPPSQFIDEKSKEKVAYGDWALSRVTYARSSRYRNLERATITITPLRPQDYDSIIARTSRA